MKEIQAYGCEHCSMTSRRKWSVVRHESNFCRKNPSRTTCGECSNMSYEEGSHEHFLDRPSEICPPSWYCLKKDLDIDYGTLNDNVICSDFDSSIIKKP